MAVVDIKHSPISEIAKHFIEILDSPDQKEMLTARVEMIRAEIALGQSTSEEEGLRALYQMMKKMDKPPKELGQAVVSCLNILFPPVHDEIIWHPAYHHRALMKAVLQRQIAGQTSSEVVRNYVKHILEYAYKANCKRAVFLLRQSSSVLYDPGKPVVILSKAWQSPRSGRMCINHTLFTCINGIWMSSHYSTRRWLSLFESLRTHLPTTALGIKEPADSDLMAYIEAEASRQQFDWDCLEGFPLDISPTNWTITGNQASETADNIKKTTEREDVYPIRLFCEQKLLFEQFIHVCPKETLESLQTFLQEYKHVYQLFQSALSKISHSR